jgi:uncharacterized membrane protein
MGRGDDGSNWLTDTLGNRPFVIGALYLVSFFLPVMVLVGVPLAYIFRSEPAEDWEASHYRYLLRTFWLALGFGIAIVMLGLFVLALSGSPEGIGLIVLMFCMIALAVVLAQFGVRTILSLSRALARQPMPRPDTLKF